MSAGGGGGGRGAGGTGTRHPLPPPIPHSHRPIHPKPSCSAEFEGFSACETVRVVMTGSQEPRSVDITEEAYAQGADALASLVEEAMKDAHAKSVEGMKVRGGRGVGVRPSAARFRAVPSSCSPAAHVSPHPFPFLPAPRRACGRWHPTSASVAWGAWGCEGAGAAVSLFASLALPTSAAWGVRDLQDCRAAGAGAGPARAGRRRRRLPALRPAGQGPRPDADGLPGHCAEKLGG